MKSSKLIFSLIITFAVLINYSLTQNSNSTLLLSDYSYAGFLGLGWGTFSVIFAIGIGVLICIYGSSTQSPTLFFILGVVVPVLDFIIVAFFPSVQDEKIDIAQNQATNVFIIIRWLYFSVMLIGVLISFFPLLILADTQQIPQRVDSRAQRELIENLEKMKKEDDDKKKEEENKNAIASDRNLNLNNQKMSPNTVSDLLNNQQTVNARNQVSVGNANQNEEQKKLESADAPKKPRTKLRRKGEAKEDN